MTRKVYILAGVSGSGKSTEALRIQNEAHRRGELCMVVSADDHFMVPMEAEDGSGTVHTYQFDPSQLGEAHAECLQRFVRSIQGLDFETVVVDNTNTTVAEVAPYAALALAYGWGFQILIFEADPVKAHARNRHGVPLRSVQAQADRLRSLQDNLPPWWPVFKVQA